MSKTALILAAHGSRHDPSVNQMVRTYAARVAMVGPFDEVAAAFHQGAPTFSAVFDELAADRVIVVPLMTSEGYYCRVVLPRELGGNRPFTKASVTITAPVGAHPAMVELVADRLRAGLRAHRLCADDTTLALIGHGTPRHPSSRRATESLAKSLRARALCREVLCAFLDDEPRIDSLPRRAATMNMVAVPFLIADGPHAARDIPMALGLADENADPFPVSGSSGGRFIVVDSAIGADPRIVEIIFDLATNALGSRENKSEWAGLCGLTGPPS